MPLLAILVALVGEGSKKCFALNYLIFSFSCHTCAHARYRFDFRFVTVFFFGRVTGFSAVTDIFYTALFFSEIDGRCRFLHFLALLLQV
jgi:hypothetical protein